MLYWLRPLGKIWKKLLLLLGRQKALHDVDRLMGRGHDAISSNMGLNLYQEILNAKKIIGKLVRKTPVDFSPHLSKLCGCNVYLKWESEQLTGSFKIRGALNKILSIDKKTRKNGVVAYSTGNHALAVAYAAKFTGINAVIYVPYSTPKEKLETLKHYPVSIKNYKKSNDEPEITIHAREFAVKNNMAFVSPYNDIKIVAGQGTIGYELWKQLPNLDSIFVCVGGGGLISGIGCYLKTMNNKIEIIGCEPENSPAMSQSIKAGKVINVRIKETLSDGSAGNNEKDTITFDLCREYVDDWVVVSEKEIADSMKLILEKHHKLVEGAAAVPLAALIKEKEKYKGKNVAVVVCGSNIGIDKLKKILCD